MRGIDFFYRRAQLQCAYRNHLRHCYAISPITRFRALRVYINNENYVISRFQEARGKTETVLSFFSPDTLYALD